MTEPEVVPDRPEPAARLIALDWGTSVLRAYLLGAHGEILETRTQPWGIMQTPNGDFAEAFRAMTRDWRQRTPHLPAIASGMIGSAQGWREVPYKTCPAGLNDLVEGLRPLVETGVHLHIVPGIAVRGALPDVMRGEETQVMGALERVPRLRADACLVLPGTHSKWVVARHGRIETFTTYMTGELFAVLRHHSLLGRPAIAAGVEWDADSSNTLSIAFNRGVVAARDHAGVGLLALLFSARTLMLTGQLHPLDTLSYLSGLLIGEELRGALAGRGLRGGGPVTLIGDPQLCTRYARAFQLFDIPHVGVIEDAATAGLWRIAVKAGLIFEDGATA
ncbi:MAG TPA: 2-dehydro-3-deoxygalactonokinase [Xanthobacteraceae bacterium]|nr:2-dehydro-3-deoxygalactonokinase [Xanthobacteraceae bacterium]